MLCCIQFRHAAPPTLYMEGATCIAYGFPLPHILWFIGSADNIISNSSSVVVLENMLGMFTIRSSILLTQSFPSNKGALYCGALNSEGSISLLEESASCPDSKTYEYLYMTHGSAIFGIVIFLIVRPE